jgi:hypothetical protein
MRTATPFLAALLMTAIAAQAGDIYRWKDDSGIWHYSDQPIAGAERVGSAKKLPAGDKPATALPAKPGAAQPAPGTGNPTVSKVREDVATDKAAKCQEAQANYQQSIESRRIYRQGADGEKVFLNDEEIEAARVTARANMEYYCGK